MHRFLLFVSALFFTLLSNAQETELIIPRGHTTPVTIIDFQEENLWLASSQGNNQYTIWNYEAEKEIRHVQLHDDPLSAITFHPGFAHCLSADFSGRLISFNIERNRKRSDVGMHEKRINGIVFISPETFYTYSDDGKVKKINYLDFKVKQEVNFDQPVKSLVYSNNKEEAVVSLSNGQLFKLNSKGVKKEIQTESPNAFVSMHLINDDNSLIAVSQNGNVSHIDLEAEKEILKKSFGIKVKSSVIIKNKLLLAGRSENKDFINVSIDDLETTKEVNIPKLKKDLDPYNISIQTIHFSEDSNLLFIPDYDHSIIAYDFDQNEIQRRFHGHTERIKEFDIARDGFTMTVASEENGLRIYDLRELFPTRILENSSPAFSCDFSNDGLLFATCSRDSLKFFSSSGFEFLKGFKLDGQYPNGETGFIANGIFAKKDNIDGISIYRLDEGTKEIIEIKDAFEFKSGFPEDYLAVKSGRDKIFLLDSDNFRKSSKIKEKGILDFNFAAKGKQVFVLSKEKKLKLSSFNQKGKKTWSVNFPEGTRAEKFLIAPGLNQLITWNISISKEAKNHNYDLQSWKLDSLKVSNIYSGLQSTITSVYYDEQRGYLIAGSEDGTIKFWSLFPESKKDFSFPASIIPLENDRLVTMMDNGVFDATRNAMESMHYVQGSEYISLDQIKSKYYEPKLLSKLFGYNKEEVNSRSPFGSIQLYPEIQLQHPGTNGGILGVDLEERGGGIGKVMIWINDKKAKEFDEFETEESIHIKYPVHGHPFLRPNEINTISVRASNSSEDIISGKNSVKYIWNTDESNRARKFYALVVGVSDYEGTRLDLEFSSKDARDITSALSKGAIKYFGEENVQIISLNSDDRSNQPSKLNILKSLNSLAKDLSAGDIFLFYFAGHGVQGIGEDSKYYLLTQEASNNDAKTLISPKEYSISDEELNFYLGKIASHNMIMILDACHSGEIVNRFSGNMDYLSTKEEKALEKLIDETGMHILAGSESDNVSYETSVYGQGLLTYSLLFGMKGEGLRDGEYLDVNRLFQYASSKVPQLANKIGGVQKPVVKLPDRLEQVDIGRYGSEEKSGIELISPRPIILPSNFQSDEMFLDVLNFGVQLDDELKIQSLKTGSDHVFSNATNFQSAYILMGRYRNEASEITVTTKVFRGKKLLDIIEVTDKDMKVITQRISKVGLGIIEKDFENLN